ncbi:MAG: PIN domain-containing protein [Gammaproteobacteria bacterium]|nr:PIN domain-containing protein [Gammaproteobacteria bacterium]
MPAKPIAISNYDFKSADRLFFDTNIWLSLYGLRKPHDPRAIIYSRIFKEILNAGSRIYIDVLIVSEFMNAYARNKHKSNSKGKFKEYRQSRAFEKIAKEIADAARRILKHCEFITSNLNTSKINVLIDEYAEGKSDFNDQVITEICKRKRLKLITDDGDFLGKGIQVLTANKKMLQN